MSENKILRSELIDEFISYRKDSNKWCDSYEKEILRFSSFCSRNWPDNDQITQEMINAWTENAFQSRVQITITFLKYLLEKNLTDIKLPELSPRPHSKYIPHSFSEEELIHFFNHCDQQVKNARSKESAMDAITTSVIFRLLYSSGLRTYEARLLKTTDADLSNGVLSIRTSKGNRQHFVVLGDDVCALLSKYDSYASAYYPGRTYFFTIPGKEFMDANELRYRFLKSWNKVNTTHAVPYDLRHNYATANINSWISKGFEFHDKMLYLSKSMGHSSIESTQYYYSLVPHLANVVFECSNDSFEEIVPEVTLYED